MCTISYYDKCQNVLVLTNTNRHKTEIYITSKYLFSSSRLHLVSNFKSPDCKKRFKKKQLILMQQYKPNDFSFIAWYWSILKLIDIFSLQTPDEL
jgi:hypothetical protein